MKLSQRSQKVKGSPTLALAAKAIELKSQGKDVISLSVGEPDWESYSECKEAGISAIKEGFTRYTPAGGTKDLKAALAQKFSQRFGENYTDKNVIVTPGAKYAVQEALWNLINPGDKVGILVPFWASYTTMVEIADGEPVLIHPNADLSINKENFEKALEDTSLKLILVNSPNNPSGAVISKEDYSFMAEALRKRPDVNLILDDIYSELYWGDQAECPHLFDVAPDLKDRALMIGGASKVFSMTGWRMGWAVGNTDIVSALNRYQSQTTGCPTSISQKATLAGVLNTQEAVKESVKLLKKRAELGYSLLTDLPAFSLEKPEGAFYFWVNIQKVLDQYKFSSDHEFSAQLLEKTSVVVVPGSDFGQPGYIRMSFAVSEELFSTAVQRIKSFLESL